MWKGNRVVWSKSVIKHGKSSSKCNREVTQDIVTVKTQHVGGEKDWDERPSLGKMPKTVLRVYSRWSRMGRKGSLSNIT